VSFKVVVILLSGQKQVSLLRFHFSVSSEGSSFLTVRESY